MSEASKKAFVEWVQKNDPFIYDLAMRRMAYGANLGLDVNWGAIFNGVVNTVTKVAPAVVDMRNQKKILDAQIKQAERGQAPMPVSNYTPTVPANQVDTAKVQAMIDDAARAKPQESGADQLMKLLPFVGIGLLALKLMKR